VRRFGRTLYELFFGVYTEKAWGMSPSRISAEWAAQRISQIGLLVAARQALRPPRDGVARGLAFEFLYPRTGGIGSIARAYARRIEKFGGEVRTGERVTAIEHAAGRVRAVRTSDENGERRIECDRVVSTIPLPLAVRFLDPAPTETLLTEATSLEFVSILFVYRASPSSSGTSCSSPTPTRA
jgi:protoporphyrinogen oxidase